ncbi:hypothetical protein HG536_0B04980 [Torulaspora globosa]|uniref:GH16 domain-containing protein n=1 Tax=Torulaspora globosa TaxID=48254 RepID=A0A7G3ZDP8_9SACH|nr:uncharacterized protein HG536_0B04980 [Torulaspora globosa]QLL31634.1 hypothetical protein HG536_0B04980 [Torulaspora globosa]
MQRILGLFCVLICFFATINAQVDFYRPLVPIHCNSVQKCPEEWPCCSPYGECGSGPVCMGGCNPRFSYNETSCAPMPALVPPNNIEYSSAPLSALDGKEDAAQLESRGLLHFNKYLISDVQSDARYMLENIAFTYSGPTSIHPQTGDIVLSMPRGSSGCLLAATRYFLYGRSSVRMRTGRSRGVISSVVIMSAVGDEIDFEFLGSELYQVQSTYYYRGELIYNKMLEVPVSSDTNANYHDYEIDWNEHRIHWLVDGRIVRTLYKEDTWDEELGIYKYPQTPMRLEVALWPGGLASNHPGTIEWAGGLIDWDNSPDMIESGKFTAHIKSMTVVPYTNRYISAINRCMRREHNIAYDYIMPPDGIFDEASFAIYCGLIPNIRKWSDSGFSIPRNPIQAARWSGKVFMSGKAFTPVNTETDFVQNINDLASLPNGTMIYNKTQENTFSTEQKSSGASTMAQNNPLRKIKGLASTFWVS